jgi:hypothetical protein
VVTAVFTYYYGCNQIGDYVRLYILTKKERKEIRKFLKNRESTNLIKVLKFRANKHIEELREDIKLLEELLEGQFAEEL